MYRAQIYLKGGGNNSGGFRYIKKSNINNHSISHELSDRDFQKYKSDVVDLTGSEGDLVIFDPYGFHGKYPCLNERRTIAFEFQSKENNYEKSQIDFNGSLITEKVLSNIRIFIHNYKKNDHYLDDYKNNYLINFNILYQIIYKSIFITINNKLKKVINRIKKKF